MSEPAKVLLDSDGDEWFLQSDGKYEWCNGSMYCSRSELEMDFGPLTDPGNGSSKGEQQKVLIDRQGDKWFLQDDGKYEWGNGHLRHSHNWLELHFGPLTERKE